MSKHSHSKTRPIVMQEERTPRMARDDRSGGPSKGGVAVGEGVAHVAGIARRFHHIIVAHTIMYLPLRLSQD